MFNLEEIYRSKIGGIKDTLALNALGASVLSTTPVMHDLFKFGLDANLALVGSSYFTWRLTEQYRTQHVLASKLRIKSADSPIPFFTPKKGFLMGYTTDTGQPVILPDDDLMRHLFFLGQSGVGKTVAGRFLMFQQIMRGGGLLFIDGKLDSKELEFLWTMMCWAGREQDLLVINPGNPAMSNTYNPILYGDPDEVADRILNLIPSSESSPGAMYFRKSAFEALQIIIGALQELKLAYHFMDLSILLNSPQALIELLTKLRNHSPDHKCTINLAIFLERYKVPGKDGKLTLDMKKFKEVFGGISSDMHTFGASTFSDVVNTYDPEVKMFDAVRNNKVIYVMLPTMGKHQAANNFGKMVVGDLRTTVSWLQALPEHERPDPNFFCYFDEAGSYINESWASLFEQSRSAHMIICPAAQTLANFTSVSEGLAEKVLGNTWTKMYFKLGTQESALAAAEYIGKHIGTLKTFSDNSGKSSSNPIVGATPEGGVGDSQATTMGEREQEMYRVSPDDLKALDKGESVVTYGGDSIYNIRVPFISFDRHTRKKFGPPRINRFRKHFVPGANFYENASRYITNQ